MSPPNFRPGDCVRVCAQPANQSAVLVGLSGRISECMGDWVTFESLRLDGSLQGAGAVPVDCLMREFDPAWQAAVQARADYLESLGQPSFADHAEIVSEVVAIISRGK